jgi:hypothetical protein
MVLFAVGVDFPLTHQTSMITTQRFFVEWLAPFFWFHQHDANTSTMTVN